MLFFVFLVDCKTGVERQKEYFKKYKKCVVICLTIGNNSTIIIIVNQ